jgi:hypothetical protein
MYVDIYTHIYAIYMVIIYTQIQKYEYILSCGEEHYKEFCHKDHWDDIIYQIEPLPVFNSFPSQCLKTELFYIQGLSMWSVSNYKVIK